MTDPTSVPEAADVAVLGGGLAGLAVTQGTLAIVVTPVMLYAADIARQIVTNYEIMQARRPPARPPRVVAPARPS